MSETWMSVQSPVMDGVMARLPCFDDNATMLESRSKLDVMPGVVLWPEALTRAAQQDLVREIFARAEGAPFYRPVMPKSGKPFSVEETNFGPLGWVSDIAGCRYEKLHPLTRAPSPSIPDVLLELWNTTTSCAVLPECCLVNRYGVTARMGLH